MANVQTGTDVTDGMITGWDDSVDELTSSPGKLYETGSQLTIKQADPGDYKIKLYDAASGNDGQQLSVVGSDGDGTNKDGGLVALVPGQETGSGKKGFVGVCPQESDISSLATAAANDPHVFRVVGSMPDATCGFACQNTSNNAGNDTKAQFSMLNDDGRKFTFAVYGSGIPTGSGNTICGIETQNAGFLLSPAESAATLSAFVIGSRKPTPSGTGCPVYFATDGSVRMTIAANGNIGMGDTSPDNMLHIRHSDSTTVNATNIGTDSIKGIKIQNADSTNNAGSVISFVNRGSGTAWAAIAALAPSANNSDLVFYTEGSDTFSEKMRILGNGNVGIGISSPNNMLQVHESTASTDCKIQITNDAIGSLSTDGAIINMKSDGDLLIENREGDADLEIKTSSNILLTAGSSSQVSVDGKLKVESGHAFQLGNAYQGTPVDPSGGGYLIVYDSGGNAYRIPAVAHT